MAVVAVVGLVLASPAIGAAKKHRSKPPHVTYDHWIVTGSTSGKHTAKPRAVITHCASDPVMSILAAGHVVRAVKHQTDHLIWLYNGKVAYRFKWEWLVNGRGRTSMGISASPPYSYPDGRYTVKLTYSHKTLGTSSLTLATDNSC